jgi:competence protein ComEC
VAALPVAQWQLGRPLPWLVLLLALGLGAWLIPGVPRLWRRWAVLLLAAVAALHLGLLWGDQLLLVHQRSGDQGRDLLIARHQGRGALVATRADAISCRQAGQLAAGLGLPGYDWILLLDPLASAVPDCWRPLAGMVLASGDGRTPLLPGERLSSAGLEARVIGADSRAVVLTLGGHPWLLLPDPQALWSWRDGGQAGRPEGVWLGFQPRARERQWLRQQDIRRVWLSGAPPREQGQQLPSGWQISGSSGWLQAGL